MKGQLRTGWKVAALLLACGAFGFAETATTTAPPAPIASANNSVSTVSHPHEVGPGTVNYIEGQASVNGQALLPRAAGAETLQPGQVLQTGANGYIEVLLTPGAYLRIGNNSEVRAVRVGLVDTTFALDRGSALIEADQVIKNSTIAVVMHGATTQIEKKGLYDLNADQQAVRVLDGKAKVTEEAGVKTIGNHDEVLLASDRPLKSRDFNEKEIKSQPLFVWSEARSADESQANVNTANYVLANGGWYGPGWYWNPYLSFYAFLPADGFLYSPFGWGLYSPGFLYAYGPYLGYPGFYRGYYGGRIPAYRNFNGHVGHFSAAVRSTAPAGGFHSFGMGGFHGAAGGGFHR
jgi:hypothetical protein